jgi:MOSC domain-containing protein YiiM
LAIILFAGGLYIMPQLIGVQTACARRVMINGRNLLNAIQKQQINVRVPVMLLGLMGDEQADFSVHGDFDKAIYAYPGEHYAFWQEARLSAGLIGIDDALH